MGELPFKTLIVRNGPLPVFQVLRICLKGFLLLSAVSFQAPSLFFTDATDELFILEWRQLSNLPLLLNLSLLLFDSNNLLTPSLVTYFLFHCGNPFPGLEERVMSFPVYRAVVLTSWWRCSWQYRPMVPMLWQSHSWFCIAHVGSILRSWYSSLSSILSYPKSISYLEHGFCLAPHVHFSDWGFLALHTFIDPKIL